MNSIDSRKQSFHDLPLAAKNGQEKELEDLQDYAESRGFEHDLAIYDVPFFKMKQRRTRLGISDDDLRDFFPLPKVFNGILKMVQSLFQIQIEEVKDSASVWHPDVKLFRVVDADQRILGNFYFDPYIRDEKGYPGGDKGWFVPMRQNSGKAHSTPMGAMILSLPTPGYGKPSLLNFEEVRELLKTFGNMLVHVVAQSEYADLSGKTGVEADALDVAANFMTQW